MDSIRKRPAPRKLPPLPRGDSSHLPIPKPPLSFSHSFTLPPQNIKQVPPRKKPEKQKSPTLKKIVKTILTLLLLSVLAGASLLLWRAFQVSRTTFTQNTENSSITETAKQIFSTTKENRKPLRGEEEGRINILLLGKAGKNYPGQNLTDTIIVASIDTKNRKTALLSLPRDLYVRIPNANASTKLNALYYYGKDKSDPFDVVRSSVAEVTGLPIHYAIALDYDGFVSIVDALGGINVTVERDFYDARYPGPNYSYETFELKKGFHTLNGATALKYVRERHSDPQGDFGRSARQQQVLEAIKNKAFTLKTFLNPLTVYALLSSIETNIRTDISLDEVKSMLTLLQEVDTQNVSTLVVDAWKKESLLRVSHIALDNGQMMFVLVPRTGAYQEIRQTALNIFSQDEEKMREQRIREENPHILLVNTTGNSALARSVEDLLSDLGFEHIDTALPVDTTALSQTYARKLGSSTKPYSLDELMKKIPANLGGEALGDYLPKKIPESADFAIILGNDIIPNYSWEKGTVEEYLRGDER